ncbi:MFS transporter, partial [Myxococcota bacterium]|nr:MFS transporter [Myxococcota bacterium]
MNSARNRWLGIIAIMLANFVGLGPSTFGAFQVGAAMDDFGFTAIEAAALISAEIVMVGLTVTIASTFIRRYSTVRVGLLGAALVISMQIASTFTDSFWSLAPLRLAAGAGGGLIQAASYAVAASSFNPDRTFSYSLSGFLFSSAVFAPILGAAIVDHGYAGACWSMVGLTLFASLFFGWLSPEKDLEEDLASDNTRRSRASWVVMILLCLSFGLFPGPMFYFFERLGVDIEMDPGRIGYFFSAGTLIGIVGSLLAARAADWAGRKLPLIAGLFVLGTSTLLFAYASTEPSYLLTVLTFWISYMFLNSFVLSTTAAFDPTGRLTVIGGGGFQILLGTGSFLGGALFEAGSFMAIGFFGLTGLWL